MIRIGFGRPGLYQLDDRWGRPVNRWDVPDWTWVSEDKWADFEFFMAPIIPWDVSRFPVPAPTNIYDLLAMPEGKRIAAQVEEKLRRSGQKSLLWQFNLPDRKEPGEWRRHVIAMGLERSERPNPWQMQPWSLVDCYILRPFWLIVALVKNRLTSDIDYD